jgi:nitroreductase
MDVGIALDHMTLVAVEEGLGTCWIGGFSQDVARETLGVPPSHTVAALLTLGFPKQRPDPKPRRAIRDIVHHDRFPE